MSANEAEDMMMKRISRLPVLRPDQARAAVVRSRCHAHVARTARPGPPADALSPIERMLTPAIVGTLSLLYLSGVVYDALRAYGLFRV